MFCLSCKTRVTVARFSVIKLSRSSVSPNFNFMGQLTDYEEELRLDREKSRLCSVAISATVTRPKRRPSRLGFLSSFLRQSMGGSTKAGLTVSPTSDSGGGHSSCSLAAPKLSTPLLPSPSVPFAKLGINSPLDELPSLTLKIDNFPSTSLDQLHFQPCQTGPRGVKVKRSATECGGGGNDSSRMRKRLSMLDSYSTAVSGTTDDGTPETPLVSAVATVAVNFQRRHSAVLLAAITGDDCAGGKTQGDGRDALLGPAHRSISYERLSCPDAAWNTASSSAAAVAAAAIICDSCRLQECHQSTSSLSSANSHSSNLLV